MKKIFLGSVVLTFFSISVLLFQLSCSDESIAKTSSTPINKIVYSRYDHVLNQDDGIYISNYDGTNQTKIDISIPGAPTANLSNPRLSPDGAIVFFMASFPVGGKPSYNIYSCKVDGSELKVVQNGGVEKWEYNLGGAY